MQISIPREPTLPDRVWLYMVEDILYDITYYDTYKKNTIPYLEKQYLTKNF